MASKRLEQALDWIMAGDNAKAFRNAFNAVTSHVKGLSAADIKILKKVHQKGMAEVEKLIDIEVSGQRSYGWEESR